MSELAFTTVVFDLDGVITKTAVVHSKAWKEMFDGYLKFREKQYDEPFREFTHKRDYLPYVDGKPRYQGVASFLKNRRIELPWGNPRDAPDMETICGLGNQKNKKFQELVKRDGVELYESTISLIQELKNCGVHVGVASSSKNCRIILETAGILDLFETCIDGIVSEELQLKGKPEPDIFTTACDNLKATYDQSVVIEDAVSGVQAGVKGNFGLVVGVAREHNDRDLRINGADIVVQDLSEIGIDDLEKWFFEGLPADQWSLNYYDYDPDRERTRESLCTVGNGYFGTRGAMEEIQADTIHYPGTYLAGVYNRLRSQIDNRTIINEDLVNCPNWLPMQFRIGGDPWFEFDNVEILNFHRRLDLEQGLLFRKIIIRNEKGQKTLVESSRLASMADPHCAAMQYNITPLNYSDSISVRAGLFFNIINTGVERYKQFKAHHLKLVSKGSNRKLIFILSETKQSKIRIAEAASILVFVENQKINTENPSVEDDNGIYLQITSNLSQGQTLRVEKLVSIFTSLDKGVSDPLRVAKQTVRGFESFDEIKQKSIAAWKSLWQKVDIKVNGDRFAQKLLRLNIYHLLVAKSIQSSELDWGIPARGLHGEAYRGHIFWDEVFCLPFYNLHFPETAESVLLYRYRRLNKARKQAAANGNQGAFFPWQSGSDGSETTPRYHLNPLSGNWEADHSHLQRHVSIAIAYNIWYYYWTTLNLEFLARYGAEMFFEIARFWASRSKFNPHTGRYEIDHVMGPDEFHEKYPDATEAGLKNNSYTNIMVVWLLGKAVEIFNLLPSADQQMVSRKIGLENHELDQWEDISTKLKLEISEAGIIAQFEGFFDLAELDWDKYVSIQRDNARMDRILRAEKDSTDRYQVIKQADVLMIFYLLAREEWQTILSGLGYSSDKYLMTKNFNYYYRRTSHGSTLSYIVHAAIAYELGYTELGWQLYQQALTSDYQDIQGGTTGEGIHTGIMAGTIMQVLKGFAGIDFSREHLRINPNLPQGWRDLRFGITFQKVFYKFHITATAVSVTAENNQAGAVEIEIAGQQYLLPSKETITIPLIKLYTGVAQ